MELSEKVKKILKKFVDKYGEEYSHFTDRYEVARYVLIKDRNNIRVRYPSMSFKKVFLANNGDDSIDGMVADEIVKKHGLEVEYDSYIPEDMHEPLWQYWFIEVLANENNLESKLEELKGIEDEIRGRYKAIAKHILSLPNL